MLRNMPKAGSMDIGKEGCDRRMASAREEGSKFPSPQGKCLTGTHQ